LHCETVADGHRILIAALVYLVGGCVYQRTVMNQRGWKQLPNYSMWSGLFSFFLVRSHSSAILKAETDYCRIWR
jgi:hypothetical protein